MRQGRVSGRSEQLNYKKKEMASEGKEITIVELFSGIGGFSKGLSDAGYTFKKHYYSEIDKHAIANYKYNFNEAEYIGSVTDVRGNGIEQPDIITFGSPCQDFSLAGKQLGMEGQRSVLILEAIRIIRECRPSVFIWENVKGAYSSNDGADFWAIIAAFANIGGYRLEWQLLNTSWFLPQNRERIYLIGHLADRSEPRVFPIGESNIGAIKGTTNSPIVRAITAGGHSGGHHSGMTLVKHRSDQPFKQGDIAQTIRNSDKGEVRIVASRGRNPQNSSDRTAGAKTEQRLEENSKGMSNTLTGVQKDNLVKISKPNHGRSKGETFDNICPSLLSQMGTGGDNVPYVNDIRRLTEIECERLQGFPDDWTKFGNYDGVVKQIPKTQRYKMCGNAVTTNVVRAIGERLNLL